MDVRHTFRHQAREKGVPAEAIEQWLRLTRPRTDLVPDGDGPPVGRFGGLPALPDGTDWPGYTSLVLTLDLAALPASGHDLDLPADGTLLFFLMPDWDVEHHAVIHVPAGAQVTERTGDAPVIDCVPLHARAGWSVPRSGSQVPFALGDQDEVLRDVLWCLDHPDYEFSIGGYGGSSTGGADYPATEPLQETVLATVWLDESRVGDTFGTTLMVVNFVISHADLAARAFDKVYLHTDFNG